MAPSSNDDDNRTFTVVPSSECKGKQELFPLAPPSECSTNHIWCPDLGGQNDREEMEHLSVTDGITPTSPHRGAAGCRSRGSAITRPSVLSPSSRPPFCPSFRPALSTSRTITTH